LAPKVLAGGEKDHRMGHVKYLRKTNLFIH
jgi:hypothetical protein